MSDNMKPGCPFHPADSPAPAPPTPARARRAPGPSDWRGVGNFLAFQRDVLGFMLRAVFGVPPKTANPPPKVARSPLRRSIMR